jgi:dUTPase
MTLIPGKLYRIKDNSKLNILNFSGIPTNSIVMFVGSVCGIDDSYRSFYKVLYQTTVRNIQKNLFLGFEGPL